MAAEIRTPAVVARTTSYGESDLVVTLITPEGGVIGCMAKGAARSKKRFAGCFEPFTLIDASIRHARHGGQGAMGLVVSADIVDAHYGIREDLARIEAGAVMLEIASRLHVPPTESVEAFGQAIAALGRLETAADPDAVMAGFWVKHLVVAGFGVAERSCFCCARPIEGHAVYDGGEGLSCHVCGSGGPEVPKGVVAFIGYAASLDVRMHDRLRLTGDMKAALLGFLAEYTARAVGVPVKSIRCRMEGLSG